MITSDQILNFESKIGTLLYIQNLYEHKKISEIKSNDNIRSNFKYKNENWYIIVYENVHIYIWIQKKNQIKLKSNDNIRSNFKILTRN